MKFADAQAAIAILLNGVATCDGVFAIDYPQGGVGGPQGMA